MLLHAVSSSFRARLVVCSFAFAASIFSTGSGADNVADAAPTVADAAKGKRGDDATTPVPPWEELLRRISAMDDKDPDINAVWAARRMAYENPALRADLIQRYTRTSETSAKTRFIDLINASATPDVAVFAQQLIASTSSIERSHGFSLLAAQPRDAKVYQRVARAMQEEKEPEVLAAAIMALEKPGIVEPAMSQSMVSRLQKLTRHVHHDVRSSSVWVLAQWDKAGKTAETSINQALFDPAPEVRHAALAAIERRQLRSEPLKHSLIKILVNKNELPPMRFTAMQALNNFALNNTEYRVYTQARLEVEKLEPPVEP
ncbi:MAG: hypothetical protein HY308_01145 [Gammaproteobacteria bacterium]|nr:hypothetical protein [Gammaproteobacteria bacterium]